MGEWSVSQWILGVMRFQKIFGLYGVERHKVEKWSGKSLAICLERQDEHYIGPHLRLDPDHWASLPGDEACGGTNQSPIDLV